MRKVRALVFLSIWVAVLPYLGFPHSWKNVLFTLTGLVLLCLSYLMWRAIKAGEGKEDFENFSENIDFSENQTN